ncbi:uncharacterized protein SOCE26_002280 [Sorangium cellulosum]|uniref:Transposase n=1 Tax=Sorangium cellulosum TaxID=56 RepID=A0A2L0EHR5_SORCE|nr:transposase [Sorangium cellulosum]AUX38848.1 uncharacterized protein SOCE26_002280 [Sorangium cellulosum]
MPKRTRRHHSSEKAALLKRHHLEKVPVSDLCDEQKFLPSLFYTWQRQLFEHAAAAFERPKASPSAYRSPARGGRGSRGGSSSR